MVCHSCWRPRRVQAAAGLVQEQHPGVADQADGQVQAAAHAAGPGAHGAVGCLGQLEPLQQLGGTAVGLGSVQVVQAAGHDQVLPAGEVVVDRGGLAGQADHLPHRGGLADHVQAGHAGWPVSGRSRVVRIRTAGGLAGAVGAEQPEHAAGRRRTGRRPGGRGRPRSSWTVPRHGSPVGRASAASEG